MFLGSLEYFSIIEFYIYLDLLSIFSFVVFGFFLVLEVLVYLDFWYLCFLRVIFSSYY